MRTLRLSASLLVLAASSGLAGCAGMGNLGALGDILGGGMGGQAESGQVRAEIRRVDQGNQTIQITTASGQTGQIRYDQYTRVIYREQEYPVTALEHGDLVVMQLQQNSAGETYVGRIDVEQSVQERSGQGGSGQVQLIDGEVGQIDHNQGAFQLRTRGATVIVTLPYNPPRQTIDRFHRLRQGEYISIEGTYLGQNRVELSRFR